MEPLCPVVGPLGNDSWNQEMGKAILRGEGAGPSMHTAV